MSNDIDPLNIQGVLLQSRCVSLLAIKRCTFGVNRSSRTNGSGIMKLPKDITCSSPGLFILIACRPICVHNASTWHKVDRLKSKSFEQTMELRWFNSEFVEVWDTVYAQVCVCNPDGLPQAEFTQGIKCLRTTWIIVVSTTSLASKFFQIFVWITHRYVAERSRQKLPISKSLPLRGNLWNLVLCWHNKESDRGLDDDQVPSIRLPKQAGCQMTPRFFFNKFSIQFF